MAFYYSDDQIQRDNHSVVVFKDVSLQIQSKQNPSHIGHDRPCIFKKKKIFFFNLI